MEKGLGATGDDDAGSGRVREFHAGLQMTASSSRESMPSRQEPRRAAAIGISAYLQAGARPADSILWNRQGADSAGAL
jgi:hypothetical protein